MISADSLNMRKEKTLTNPQVTEERIQHGATLFRAHREYTAIVVLFLLFAKNAHIFLNRIPLATTLFYLHMDEVILYFSWF
jgi:hypothetical protein